MQFDYRPGKIIAKKGIKYLHNRTSGNRETITNIACVSAMGNSPPSHFIVKDIKKIGHCTAFKLKVHQKGAHGVFLTVVGLSRELHFSGLPNHFFKKLVLTYLNYFF